MKKVIWTFILLAAAAAGWLAWRAAEAGRLPPVLFLGWDAQARIQLFRIEVGDEEPAQLTQETAVILSFAPSPNGKQIAYATDEGIKLMGSNGRSPRILLPCPHAQCDHLVWHPDSRRLLYERRQADTPNLPQLWWLDSETGDTRPLEAAADSPSQAASFSADGRWLSYAISPDQGTKFFNLKDSTQFTIPAGLGSEVRWAPAGDSFIYQDHQLTIGHGSQDSDHQAHTHDFTLSVSLFSANLNQPAGVPISGSAAVDDSSPAWSPDGAWIVTGRTQPGTDLGRQLVLMRPDGSQMQILTDEPGIHHGLPAWSPDGQFILYQRFDTAHPDGRAAVWRLEISSLKQIEMIPEGFLPQWDVQNAWTP